MQFKPDYENFLKTVRGGKPSRIPLAEFFVDNPVHEKVLHMKYPPYDGTVKSITAYVQGQIEFALKCGYDFITVHTNIQPGKPPEQQTNHETVLKQYEHSGPLSTWDKFNSWTWYAPYEADLRPIEIASNLVPDGMGIMALMNGLWDNVMLQMGMEQFFVALYDDIKLVNAITQKMSEANLAGFDRVKQIPHVIGVLTGGDIGFKGGLMFSLELCQQIFIPEYEKLIKKIHDSGKVCVFHTDGNVTELLPDFLKIKLDGLHAIEPAAMDIMKTRELVNNELCLFGNVDIDWPLTRGTPSDVRQVTAGLLEKMSPTGAYCIGSSNSITWAVPIENYLAMINTVREFNGIDPVKT
jgi:hypothetical protein